VLVVVDPADYERVAHALTGAAAPLASVRSRARPSATADYDAMIASTSTRCGSKRSTDVHRDPSSVVPRSRPLAATVGRPDLKDAANPPPAAWCADSPRRLVRRRHQGKELSFTNLLDLDAAARIAWVRTSGGRDQAHESLRRGDRNSPGVCACATRCHFRRDRRLNRAIDVDTARLVSTFIEAVPVARGRPPRLMSKQTQPARRHHELRQARGGAARVVGGWLVQARDRVPAAAPWPMARRRAS
jgi:hypothetical protein